MMYAEQIDSECGCPVEAFAWDPALDREAESKRLELERLLDEIDEFE